MTQPTPTNPKPNSGVDRPASDVSQAVAQLYNTYPFPPEPLLDEPPPGYNWRWYWPSAYSFCTGRLPDRATIRILDAGCGTGVGTDYLVHLNPEAAVTAVDLSPGAIAVAQERLQRSGAKGGADRVTFHNLSIYDLDQIPGEFEMINCVGVLHHMPDPKRGIEALARKLAPGGILHIFVYGELGRFEIQLMQEAIGLLQGDRRGDYTDGVALGRQIFATLPDTNRLVSREKSRWSFENNRDENFADMYVHPQEIDYNVNTLFDLIDASGLDFLGFSNPDLWDLSRLIGNQPALMERAAGLDRRSRYRLAELLDPDSFSHYEFFLARPTIDLTDWSDPSQLGQAIPQISPCIHGWPSQMVLNQDYRPVDLSPAGFELMTAIDQHPGQPIAEILGQTSASLDDVRQLWRDRLLFLRATP
jgi:SAM-dependent methyltransferase